MNVEQSDLCESTCKTLWRSVCKTLEQRELCESTFKTFWRSVCKTWEHRACNIGETKYLQQDKREVDMNACYRKRTYRRYCPPNQPRAKTRERSTWMLAKQDQIWATPPHTNCFSVLLGTTKPLHREVLHREVFTQRSFYTQRFLFLHKESKHYTQKFYTEKLLHTEVFTHRRFYTQMSLHSTEKQFVYFTRETSTQSKLLHKQAFTQTSFYTDRFYSKQVFTQRSFYTEQAFTYATATEIAAPKPDLGTKAKKGQFWNTSLNEF